MDQLIALSTSGSLDKVQWASKLHASPRHRQISVICYGKYTQSQCTSVGKHLDISTASQNGW